MSRLRSLAAAAAAAVALPAAAAAQATPYYILDGDAGRAFIVQNGAVQSTFALPFTNGYPLYPVRWDGTSLLVSNRSGSAAVEYSTTGTPTGTTYANAGGLDQLLDGATDGTNTYAVRCCSWSDGVYKGDMQFGGMTQISTYGLSGIAYASSTGTLFATDFSGYLHEMTTTGTLLNSTLIGHEGRSLAYEASSNSLWFGDGGNTLYNYSLTGTELQQITVAGLGGNFFGGEMANAPVTATPEPATVALMGTGLLALAGIARRRRS